MKLAEALAERKAAQDKVGELSARLQRVALVQEGDRAAEEPAALLRELDEVVRRLEGLIVGINHTNATATLPDGRTLTAAIAQRDMLRMRIGVLDALLSAATNQGYRSRGTEIKWVATVDVAELQRSRDALAGRYRQLDTSLQAANWSIELEERQGAQA